MEVEVALHLSGGRPRVVSFGRAAVNTGLNTAECGIRGLE